MPPFLHDRLRRLGELVEASSAALRAYTALGLDLDARVVAFLDGAATAYRELGSPDAENAMLALRAQYASARSGVHPLTLERVTTRRREMERSVALRVLVTGAEQVRGDWVAARDELLAIRDRLVPPLTRVLRNGQRDQRFDGDRGQAHLERVWQEILADAESAADARRIGWHAHHADVLLLLADLLSSQPARTDLDG